MFLFLKTRGEICWYSVHLVVGVYIKITYHNIANIETIDVYIPVAGNLPGVHGVYDLDEGGDGGVERAHGEHEDVRHEGHPG